MSNVLGVEVFAIGTAICIAVSSLIATEVSRAIGAFSFTKWRMIVAFAVMATLSSVLNIWTTLSGNAVILLALSGLVGIVVGDVAIYAAMGRIGPRRTSVIFSVNSAISATLGFALYEQTPNAMQILGIALTMAGVVIAITFREVNVEQNKWETVLGSLKLGVTLAVLAAICQAAGAALSAPAMNAGVAPIAATAVRVGVAGFVMILLSGLRINAFRQIQPLNRRLSVRIVASALIGMCMGMTLLMLALSGGSIGTAMTFASLTPIAILPLLWIVSRRRPSYVACTGALLACTGVGLLLNFK